MGDVEDRYIQLPASTSLHGIRLGGSAILLSCFMLSLTGAISTFTSTFPVKAVSIIGLPSFAAFSHRRFAGRISSASRVQSSPVPIIYDASHGLHFAHYRHPERPARIELCLDVLEDYKRSTGSQSDHIQLIDVSLNSTTACEQSELDKSRSMLVMAHTEQLVNNLEEVCNKAMQGYVEEGRPQKRCIGNIDHDTYITTDTFNVCLRTMTAWIRAVDLAMEDRASGAIALTRPPGHHALKEKANGFCLFNFAAAAAIHVLSTKPEIKVSVLDWDVHFGQGVADILQSHARSRYVSIHQIDAFPNMQEQRELTLSGEHQNILTIPIPRETTWTSGYEQVFREKALPFIYTAGEWEPDVVIVCCGFDALDSERLAQVSLEVPDYGRMTRLLRKHISQNRAKRPGLMLGMEGGYQLDKKCPGGNIADALLETVKALID